MKITEHEARELWARGYPVRLANRAGEAWWYDSAATTSRTFEEHRMLSVRGLAGLPAHWEHDPKRATRGEAAGHIMRREHFTIGNLSARIIMRGRGDLPEKYLDGLITKSRYVVYSYDTPIAWVHADGTIVMPPVRYSNTTTQHQWMVAQALGVKFSTTESARKGKGRTPYTHREGW